MMEKQGTIRLSLKEAARMEWRLPKADDIDAQDSRHVGSKLYKQFRVYMIPK